MNIFLESIVLGLIQGLTEFLPISSSAHLALLPQMLGWKSPLLNSLAFDVALHFGTLLAIGVYFRDDLWSLTRGFIRGIFNPHDRQTREAKLGWYIILGTVPVVLAGLLLQDEIDTTFRIPWVIASWLIGFSLVMAAAEVFSQKQKSMEHLTGWDAIWIGIAQVLALMPGVSRSGATISAGLFLGFKRAEAARYSFLLSVPAVMGAIVFHSRQFLNIAMDQSWVTLALGTMTAAVSGYLCIRFLLAYLQHRTLYIFIGYRLLAGGVVIAWTLLGYSR